MTMRDFDPLRLDVAPFAEAGAQLDGEWPLAQLPRLAESAMAEALAGAGARPVVRWSARGEHRTTRLGDAQVWLHLSAAASLPQQCQRCLGPVEVPLQVQRSVLFVAGEAAAAALDAELDEDVLALTRALDLRELVEDELLLALPLVPRHEVCPTPLRAEPEAAGSQDDAAPHPFAALAALKRTGRLN